ncbi:MAG TPA: STAS domain-containing protein [Puia sp.]|nr:STAS domain-containing protein [Puia sp.]
MIPVFDRLSRHVNNQPNMNVKIDTNRNFHAIRINEPELAANMTDDLRNCLIPFLQNDVKNLIVIMKDIQKMDLAAAKELLEIRDQFYANRASFILCEPQSETGKLFTRDKQFETLQVVPTFSEASDLVFMEDIERELTG